MGIFRLTEKDPNIGSILETLMRLDTRTIMAQRYIPDIVKGDKRVLVIGGEVVPYALARIPQNGETRGNLAAGGRGVAQELSARDREIAETLAPELKRRGILLAGLDIIGECLTEVNVTSPTGFQEISKQKGWDVAARFIDAVERTQDAGCFQTARIRKTIMQTPEQDPNSYAAQIKGKSGLRRIINACGYTRDGFKAACEEQGFRQLLWLNIPLIVLAFILPFGLATRMILIASSFLSLIVELFNTGVEAAVDHTSLEKHPLAKRAKDVCSAAQGLALLLLALLWLLALWREYDINVF